MCRPAPGMLASRPCFRNHRGCAGSDAGVLVSRGRGRLLPCVFWDQGRGNRRLACARRASYGAGRLPRRRLNGLEHGLHQYEYFVVGRHVRVDAGGVARPQTLRRDFRQGGRRHECAAASGVRDGGRSPAISLQERVANHRKRRWSKARVVSVTEKAPQRRQVGDRKANTREPPFKCRKCSDDVETGELCCTGISLDDACLRSRRRPA